jgi:hypothetical protein
MSPRRFAHAGAALLLGCAVATSASAQRETATDAGAQQDAATTTPAQLPDWSGQWENVGATPSPDGGFYESLEEVLTKLEWSPPNKPEAQAAVDKVVAVQRKAIEAMRQGKDPGGAVRACTFGYPTIMLESPLMFEVLTTPKETALIFSSREIRHVYTDGREHPGKDDIWPTPWGDSIGHWEGDTLVIDTIAVKPAFPGRQSTAVMAFGGIEEAQTIAFLSPDARFVERLRMIDKDHLENQITIIDPANLTELWHMRRTYQRVENINRMVYEDCEGEERNPIVDGKFTLTPPPE